MVSSSLFFEDIPFKKEKIYPLLHFLNNEGRTFFILKSHQNSLKDGIMDASFLHDVTKFLGFFFCLHPLYILKTIALSVLIYKKAKMNFLLVFVTLLKGVSFYRAQEWIFKHLLRKTNVNTIIFTDFCSYLGAVKASKNAHIQSVDLQHGMFGADDPTYRWPLYAQKELPIPSTLVVHGKWWKKIVLATTLWQEKDVFIYAPQELFQHAIHPSSQKFIIWATQWTTRSHSMHFLPLLLKEIDEHNMDIMVCIKLHPSDHDFREAYETIQKAFPKSCFIAPENVTIYPLIAQSLGVVSYGSTVILEALALKIPSISLCCDGMEHGFGGLFSLHDIDDCVPHITHPQELIHILKTHVLNDEALNHWKNNVFMLSKRFYREDAQSLVQRMQAWNLI